MIVFALQYKLDLNQCVIVDCLMFLRISIFCWCSLITVLNLSKVCFTEIIYHPNYLKHPKKLHIVSDCWKTNKECCWPIRFVCSSQQCNYIDLLVEEATKVVAKEIFLFRVRIICDFCNSQLFPFILLPFWLGNKENTLKKKQPPKSPKNNNKKKPRFQTTTK